MKLILYKVIFNIIIHLPDTFHIVLFEIIFPLYKFTHKKRAYGRVLKHLKNTRVNTKPKDVFKSLYFNGIDSYRILANISSAKKRVYFENESIIQESLKKGPIIALSIHQGAFENLHRSLCKYSNNVYLITNPLKNKTLTKIIQKVRSHKNLYEYKTKQISIVLRSLFKTKGILAMVVDQAHEARGNIIKLFGMDSTIYMRLPIKANQMGAGIVTFRTWSEFSKNKFQKKIKKHIVRFENYYPPKTDEKILLNSIAQEIENWITEHPEQWCFNYHKNFTI